MPEFQFDPEQDEDPRPTKSGCLPFLVMFLFLFGGSLAIWRFMGPGADRTRTYRAPLPERSVSATGSTPEETGSSAPGQLADDRHAAEDALVGRAASRVSNLEEATEQFKAGKQAYQFGRMDEAQNRWNAGYQAYADGEVDAALAHWEAAISLLENTPGTEGQRAQLESARGWLMGDAGRYEAAIVSFKSALSLYGSVFGSEPQCAFCYERMGVAQGVLERFSDAVDSMNSAISLYEHLPNTQRELAHCYLISAIALTNLREYPDAMRRAKTALGTYAELPGCHSEQIRCYLAIGEILAEGGAYEEAVRSYDRAMAVVQQSRGLSREEADCLLDTSDALNHLGDHEAAIKKCEEAMGRYREAGDEHGEAQCRSTMALALERLGRLDEALLLYQQTIHGLKANVNARRDLAHCLTNTGATLYLMGRYDEAISKESEAIQFFGTGKQGDLIETNSAGIIGMAYSKKGQHEKAVEWYRKARSSVVGVWLCTRLAKALEVSTRTEDLQEAIQELVIAIDVSEILREQRVGADSRMAASGQATPAYSHLARFLVNRSRENWELKEEELVRWATAAEPGLRCLEAACHFADAGKARTLIELIQQRQVDVREDPKGKALLDEDRQLLAQIGQAHEQRETARQKDIENTVKELEGKIDGWQQRRRQIEYELKKTYVGKFTAPEYQKASEIQSGLPEGLAILQYVVTEDDSRLIVLTRNSITAYDIPVKAEVPWDIPSKYKGQWKQDALAALAGRFATDGSKVGLEGLVRLYRAPMDTARTAADAEKTLPETMVSVGLELGRLLLPDPMRKLLANEKVTHLVVIPDGQLHALPFAALPTGSRGSVEPKSLAECRFLVEEYRISYLPSWSMLGAIRSAAKERKAEGKQKEFLALADPVFSKDDPRIGKPLPPDQVKPLEVAAVLRSFYEKYGWKRLEETAVEARKVADQFGGASVVKAPEEQVPVTADAVVYTGPAATAKVLQHADQYRRILFATHGLADPRNAWLSCVLLSSPPEQGYETPGYLKAADIIGLKLNADLVTLSACETGLGRLQSGEGMIGLSSAFFISGARSLALTLWKVPSGETAEVSVRFHELLKTQPDKAEALRQAQLNFLAKHPDKRHPFYWAAFVLTGDWQ